MIKTAFGEVSIPLSEVAGIRFASGDDVTYHRCDAERRLHYRCAPSETHHYRNRVGTSKSQRFVNLVVDVGSNMKWVPNTGTQRQAMGTGRCEDCGDQRYSVGPSAVFQYRPKTLDNLGIHRYRSTQRSPRPSIGGSIRLRLAPHSKLQNIPFPTLRNNDT